MLGCFVWLWLPITIACYCKGWGQKTKWEWLAYGKSINMNQTSNKCHSFFKTKEESLHKEIWKQAIWVNLTFFFLNPSHDNESWFKIMYSFIQIFSSDSSCLITFNKLLLHWLILTEGGWQECRIHSFGISMF